MNMLQANGAGDISLESIAVMAEARDLPPTMLDLGGRLCRKGMQYTGSFANHAWLCSICAPRFGYTGIGDYSACGG